MIKKTHKINIILQSEKKAKVNIQIKQTTIVLFINTSISVNTHTHA